MDIKQLIGETTYYDKKLALETKRPKSWCKSISAFANCFGGKLVFGVADDELVGLANAEEDAEKISEAIKIHLNPIPDVKLSFQKDGAKTFIIVEVMKGQQTPYYYDGDGQLVAFMRIGNESVPATPSQLRELVLRGSGESYDSLKSRYDFDNMSFTKLKSVKFPKTLKRIDAYAFSDTQISSLQLPDNVTVIGEGAFYPSIISGKIKTIKLPAKLKTIGKWAFEEQKFTELTIPANVEKIGAQAFSGCQSLKKIVIKSKKLKKIGSRAFATIGQNAVIFVPKERAEDYRKMIEDSTAHAQIVIQ